MFRSYNLESRKYEEGNMYLKWFTVLNYIRLNHVKLWYLTLGSTKMSFT